MISIDKNIPIPDLNPNRGGVGIKRPDRNSYPFEKMEVGDSFLCTNRTAAQLITSAMQWARRCKNDYNFVSRTLPEGVRIWRIK